MFTHLELLLRTADLEVLKHTRTSLVSALKSRRCVEVSSPLSGTVSLAEGLHVPHNRALPSLIGLGRKLPLS